MRGSHNGFIIIALKLLFARRVTQDRRPDGPHEPLLFRLPLTYNTKSRCCRRCDSHCGDAFIVTEDEEEVGVCLRRDTETKAQGKTLQHTQR